MTLRPSLRLLIVGLGTLVVPLDTTVNLAFPHIVAAFGITMPEIKWVVICYVGVHASLMLICGRLGDLFGYRRVFLAGCAWSAAAFVMCSLAPAYGWLLAARAMQGVGAALVLSVGPALATAAFPPGARTRILGLYTMMFGIGAAIGPPLAGLLVARWGWAAVYAFRIPLALLSFLLALFLPANRPTGTVPRFDLAGGALMVSATACLLLGLDQIQTASRWVAPLLGLAGLAGWAFIRVERRSAAPLVSPRHFADPRLGRALVEAIGVNIAGFSILLLAPFLLARTADLAPLATGLVLAASPLGMVIAAPLAERIAARIGVGALTRFGLGITAAGLGLLAFAATRLPLLALGMLIQGFGQGLFQVANFDQVTGSLPPQDRGVAGSLALLTRTFGLMLGATLLMLLMQTLAGGTAPAQIIAGIAGTYAAAALIPAALLLVRR